ncbi:Cobalt/magnesium transport protein CorA [Meiothermus luteus]|jgi:magnesium transporter|uniref:Cobalt/magnesium transport protein CorA n=1 Tax=Meiothermus luteus TaxID=2026184 RepID=A0A399ERY7_9DEIN|nr:magnesium transporter CorA family protein [Meiothermus luteus]RIH86266.1 Cobalt/magnesium transport protein CorA [Meiothermus luteus]RMH57646.1 MAG: magnesium transporter CorA [Deinococcota bacterium]
MIRAKRFSDGMTTGLLPTEVWVDAETPTPEELALIQEHYPLNPLALADAQEIGHWSRFEEYPRHLFLVFRTLENPANPHSRTERVSYFYFPEVQVLLTYRNEPVHYLEEIWQSFRGGTGLRLWQRLLDQGVETFFAYTDALTDRVEELEERALDGADAPELPRRIFSARREVLRVRRLASQAREALLHLERLPLLGPEAYLFRDLTDRMGRVYEGLDAARDELSNVLEVHLSTQGNRLNRVVQTLTVISVLFLPMTLWAGIYGTNFEAFSEYQWPWGRLYFWGGLALIGGGLAWWMRRRGWW